MQINLILLRTPDVWPMFDKLTTIFLIRRITAVIFTITNKPIRNTLPVSAFELGGVTTNRDCRARPFIRPVTTMSHTVTDLPFGNADVVFAAKLRVQAAVSTCKGT